MKIIRNRSFDVIRTLACLMVIFTHSPMPQPHLSSSYLLSCISFFCAPCVDLFFMLSGALILPIKTDTKTFLKHRLGKVVGPIFFWTFFYLLVVHWIDNTPWNDLWISICSIPFTSFGYGLWFMYVLVGLYLVAPILSPWLQSISKRELQFFLFLWVVTLCYPILSMFVIIDTDKTAPLYYFSGYIGFFVLGYYLRRYYRKYNLWMLSLFFLIPLSAAIICKLGEFNVNFYTVFWYSSVFVAMMCVFWFQSIQQLWDGEVKIPNWVSLLLTDFSNCSFGIYLIHMFIMRKLLWKSDFILKYDWITQIALIFILTTLFSYVIVHLISYLPGAKYVIGYGRRKK